MAFWNTLIHGDYFCFDGGVFKKSNSFGSLFGTYVFLYCWPFLLMNAQFLAIVHIAVYSGAIMVLFLFVIMLMNLNKESEPKKSMISKLIAVILGGLLLLVLVGALKGTNQLNVIQVGQSDAGLITNLGKVLFKEFLFPFEIVSILLLSALVGAIMLGKKKR